MYVCIQGSGQRSDLGVIHQVLSSLFFEKGCLTAQGFTELAKLTSQDGTGIHSFYHLSARISYKQVAPHLSFSFGFRELSLQVLLSFRFEAQGCIRISHSPGELV